MNKNIKALIIMLILTFLVGYFVLNPLVQRFFSSFNQGNIYDDDNIIARDSDSYNYHNRQGSVVNNVAEIKCDLTGMDTLWSFTEQATKEMTLKYDIKLAKGDFKVVLVKPNKEVEVLVEGAGTGDISFTLESGKSAIKIVGRKSSVDLYLKIID